MAVLDDAVEQSTYVALVTFYDEDLNTVVPVSAEWSLRDNTGAIVNSRSAQSIIVATTVAIVLSGDDLAYEENSSTMRTLTVTGVYNSSYGSSLPLADEFTFDITPLVGV